MCFLQAFLVLVTQLQFSILFFWLYIFHSVFSFVVSSSIPIILSSGTCQEVYVLSQFLYISFTSAFPCIFVFVFPVVSFLQSYLLFYQQTSKLSQIIRFRDVFAFKIPNRIIDCVCFNLQCPFLTFCHHFFLPTLFHLVVQQSFNVHHSDYGLCHQHCLRHSYLLSLHSQFSMQLPQLYSLPYLHYLSYLHFLLFLLPLHHLHQIYPEINLLLVFWLFIIQAVINIYFS